ncbi:MAG: Uma2 family endonuclease [Candidatus Kapabacteria bacterium]|jgi:Uma2 family endonuclease|nr:Uma2 family endonuclease [Candidatus Kapabacteria bacterium]
METMTVLEPALQPTVHEETFDESYKGKRRYWAEIGDYYPPTEDELPYDDGEPMESDRHALQLDLLIETLTLAWAEKDDVCIAGNMGVYYGLEQAEKLNFRAPDFFISHNVPKRFRKSYIIWVEEKAPDLVIELLSEGTVDADRGIKKEIYQDKMRVHEYILFDVETAEIEAYRLGFSASHSRREYQPVTVGKDNTLACEATPGLGLMTWEGEYRNKWSVWLRWYDLATGEVLPTGAEMAKTERKRADELSAELQAEREKALKLAEKLRALGMNPDDL